LSDLIEDLPAGMHKKNGRHYVVQQGDGRDASGRIKRVWRPLSRDVGEAMRQYDAIKGTPQATAEPPPAWLVHFAGVLFSRAKARAAQADIYFALSRDDILRMGEASNWTCALTGIRFALDRTENARSRAYAPSVDRILSNHGYTRDNVRLVCVAVNAALNEWGEEVFRRLALAYCRKHRISPKA
jgi:hypothetical protein